MIWLLTENYKYFLMEYSLTAKLSKVQQNTEIFLRAAKISGNPKVFFTVEIFCTPLSPLSYPLFPMGTG